MTRGETMRMWREKRGLSQYELADLRKDGGRCWLMDVRENLVDLLTNSPQLDVLDWTTGWEEAANYLIDHGVTIQEWISVKDGLPESGKEGVLIALLWGGVDIGWCEDGRWRSEFVNEYEDGEVTHWMPLPELPKGE